MSCDRGAAIWRPQLLHASHGWTTFAYGADRDHELIRIDATGHPVRREHSVPAQTAVANGAWSGVDDVWALGSADGGIHIRDSAHRVDLLRSSPSTRVGHFSLVAHVPEGGFFGTHLLVARVIWSDQEARLVDWFEAVSKSGEPVLRPSYRVALTMAERDRTR